MTDRELLEKASRMKKNAIAIGCAVLTAAFCAFVAWCGGYDFDHRGEAIAEWVIGTMLFSAWVGGVVKAFL